MSADSANDFFWQAMSSSDSNGDLQLQRTAFDNFVSQGNEDSSQMQLHIQSESSPSPTSIIATSGENANNNNRLSTSSSPTSQQALYTTVNADAGSPTNTQQGLLPYGVINPDAIIPQSRSYTCRICQVTFPNKSAVTVHSRIHTDHEGKPYRCSFCGKGFSTNFYLKQHERIHNGQKPYKCPMCEHSFKQLSHVQQHVRTHTGVRPYKCHWPDCGKAFLQQSHLKSHVERHSPKPSNGVRPYKCHWPECGKSFAQISSLKAHVARHAPKTQKRKSSNDTKIQQEPEIPVVENQVHKENIEDNMDPGCFSLVSMPPDVIGQAAAAANIVPVPVHYESICPFLCPGCSKLYVREATFKKHLEECKTKLQLSISATAAALGIDPPPLPPPNSQSSPGFQSNTEIVVMPMDVNLNNEAAPPAPKKSRKNQKPRSVAKIELQQQQQFVDQTEQQEQILVEMPLDVNLDHCSPQLTEGSLGDNNVKQEVLGIPLDGSTTGDVMLKLPQQALSVAASANDNSNDANGVNQFFSSVAYNQIQNTSQFLDNNLFTNQQLVTSSSPLNLPIVTSQPLTSSQSIMLSGASVVGDGNIIIETFPKGGATGAGHTTINQAALKWQWDQPRMNFP